MAFNRGLPCRAGGREDQHAAFAGVLPSPGNELLFAER